MQEQQAIRRAERRKSQQQVTLFICTHREFESCIVSLRNKLINLKVLCRVRAFFFPWQDRLKQNILGILTSTWLTRTRSCSLSAWEIEIIRIVKVRRRCQLSFERIFPFCYFQVRRISHQEGKRACIFFPATLKVSAKKMQKLMWSFLLQALFQKVTVSTFMSWTENFFMAKLNEHCIGLCKRTAQSKIFDGKFSGQKK